MSALLITGASSKLALPVFRNLRLDFSEITLLTKSSRLPFIEDSARCINFDLQDSSEIPVNANVIIHFAAIVPYKSREKVMGVVEENSRMFFNILRYAKRQKAKVIFISSTDVYPLVVGESINETTNPSPHNQYGLSKLVCERMGETISQLYDIPLSILRLGPMYSETDSSVNKVSGMLADMRNHKKITVIEPDNVPSLLHVESAAEAIAAAVFAMPGKYVIAGYPLSIYEFMDNAKNAYLSTTELNVSSVGKQSIRIVFDQIKAKRDLGWAPYSVDKMFSIEI